MTNLNEISKEWGPLPGEPSNQKAARLMKINLSLQQVNGDLGLLREDLSCAESAGKNKNKQVCQSRTEIVKEVVNAAKIVMLKDIDFSVALAQTYASKNPSAVESINEAIQALTQETKAVRGVIKQPEEVPVDEPDSGQILSEIRGSIDNAKSMKKIMPTVDLAKVLGALGALDKALGANTGIKPNTSPIELAKQIITNVDLTADETLKATRPDADSDAVKKSLKDAQAYLNQAGPGDPTTSVPSASPTPCVSAPPASPQALRDCLNNADAILGGELTSPSMSEERKAWIDRARRSIESITRREERPHQMLGWLAAGFSLLALILLAVTFFQIRTVPRAKPMSDATQAELNRLDEAVTAKVGQLKRATELNNALIAEKEAAEASVRELTRKLRAQQQEARETERVPQSPLTESALQATRKDAAERVPETPQVDADGFGANVVANYNLARRQGPDLEDRFMSHYAPTVAMECTNLALRNLEGGRLPFKEASRGSFFSLKYKNMTCLFPQFNMEYRSSENIMRGIFKYPPGASPNLKLKSPAVLTPSADGWVLEKAGEFVDA